MQQFLAPSIAPLQPLISTRGDVPDSLIKQAYFVRVIRKANRLADWLTGRLADLWMNRWKDEKTDERKDG